MPIPQSKCLTAACRSRGFFIGYAASIAFALILSMAFLIPTQTVKSVKTSSTLPRSVNGCHRSLRENGEFLFFCEEVKVGHS